jgi:hypothetical protein
MYGDIHVVYLDTCIYLYVWARSNSPPLAKKMMNIQKMYIDLYVFVCILIYIYMDKYKYTYIYIIYAY